MAGDRHMLRAHTKSQRGGIGRRARFKIAFLRKYGFDSHRWYFFPDLSFGSESFGFSASLHSRDLFVARGFLKVLLPLGHVGGGFEKEIAPRSREAVPTVHGR